MKTLAARFGSIATTLVLLLAVAANQSLVFAEAYSDGWPAPGTAFASVGEYSAFTDRSDIRAVSNVKSSGVFDEQMCPDGVDAKCDPYLPNTKIYANVILPMCSESRIENCIEGLDFVGEAGAIDAAEFLRTVSVGGVRDLTDQGLYSGTGVSLFTAKKFPNLGGTSTYAVTVAVSLEYSIAKRRFVAQSVSAGVYPFSTRMISNPGGWRPNGCQWADSSECGVLEDFADSTRIRLRFRASSDLTGWFRGRITEPTIKLSSVSSSNTRFEIEATPVNVARMRVELTESNISQEQRTLMVATGGNFGPGAKEGNLFGGGTNKYPFAHWGDFHWIDVFRALSGDRAAAVSTVWGFDTVGVGSGNACLNDKSRVLGIVSTNATMFNGIVPEFKGGALTYQVAAMHYLPDGVTPFLGTYDLLIRSDVARCLYNFSNAPVSATISVVSETGESRVATTTVTEDANTGWLRLSARGFTFSAPTVRVVLQQAHPAATKVSSIRCQKGSKTKAVRGLNPKCPVGWKKSR